MEQRRIRLGLMKNSISNILYINRLLNNSINSIIITKQGDLLLNVKSKSIKSFITFLKLHTNMQTKLLLDLFAVDYPNKNSRFNIIYTLTSIVFNYRIFISINIMQDQIVDSVMDIFNSSNWLEREIWDMFGIFFKNHKDLRRILTDYGFEGFPLRKDFPLTGYLQFRYDDENQTVVSEPVELAQEFRSYEYSMPWHENK